MRTVGLLGGMSAESTTYYYQTLNRLVRERLGPMHSAQVVIWSIDFAPMAELQARGDWAAAGAELVKVAQALERAGAEALMIGANTMHVCAPKLRRRWASPDPYRRCDRRGDQGPGLQQASAAGHPLHHGDGVLYRPPGGHGHFSLGS